MYSLHETQLKNLLLIIIFKLVLIPSLPLQPFQYLNLLNTLINTIQTLIISKSLLPGSAPV